MLKEINQLNDGLNSLMGNVFADFRQNDVCVVMPTYVPQRGEILREFANNGVKTFISGGYQNAQTFPEVPQKGLPEDTMEYVSSFPQHITQQIADTIPEALLREQKVAIFTYEVDFGWKELILARNLDTKVVSTIEQSQRGYFEEKGNLSYILDKAGLSAYKIPVERVDGKTSIDELVDVYDRLKDEKGRVVVQDCCSENGNTAGKGTLFFEDCASFVKNIKETGTKRKVAKYISGYESNLSFFAGNLLAAENILGAKKIDLSPEMNAFDPQTLDVLTAKAAAQGINEENIVTVVGRGTLKAVGDEHLTSSKSNGVGNDVGYVYPEDIQQQISEIGFKLSKTLALAGHVGLAGADLMIDKNGKIWINEINDRQQGPTAQMSKDAENSGIPSLLKISLLSSYADFNDTEVQNVFRRLREKSADIHRAYAFNSGEFYLKVHSTQAKGHKAEIQRNLKPGFYEIKKQESGEWKLDFSSYKSLNSQTPYATNPREDRVVVKISGGDWKVGDKVDNGCQLFRLSGITDTDTPPLIVDEGKTRLNPEWRPVIEACYDYVFGKGYMRQNELYKQRNQDKNQMIISILQGLKRQRQ